MLAGGIKTRCQSRRGPGNRWPFLRTRVSTPSHLPCRKDSSIMTPGRPAAMSSGGWRISEAAVPRTLFSFIAVQPPCPLVPKENFPIQALADEGVLGGRLQNFDYECQRVFELRPTKVVSNSMTPDRSSSSSERWIPRACDPTEILTGITGDYYPYNYSKIAARISRPQCRLVVGTRGDCQSPRRMPSCPRALIVRRNQPVAHRVANQFRLVLQSELLHDAGTMILNRPWTDVEAFRNLAVRLPLRRHLQDLALSRGQGVMGIEHAGLGLLDVGIEGDLGYRRTEETSARGRFSDRADQILLRAAF